MDPIKGVAIAGGTVVVVGGSGYGIVSHINKEPSDKHPLAENASGYDNDPFVGDNKTKFVDPDKVENKEWWDWAFRHRFSKQNSVLFGSITNGFQATETSATHLNQACKTALKKPKHELVNKEERIRVWKFCSMDGDATGADAEPFKRVVNNLDSTKSSDPYNVNTKLGGVNGNKEKLVADDESNKEWWNWIYENILKSKRTTGSTSGILSTEFNAVDRGYGTETTALSKVCKTAHSKVASDFSGDKIKYKQDIKDYCSIGGEVNWPAS